jgi:hypothetical protein
MRRQQSTSAGGTSGLLIALVNLVVIKQAHIAYNIIKTS